MEGPAGPVVIKNDYQTEAAVAALAFFAGRNFFDAPAFWTLADGKVYAARVCAFDKKPFYAEDGECIVAAIVVSDKAVAAIIKNIERYAKPWVDEFGMERGVSPEAWQGIHILGTKSSLLGHSVMLSIVDAKNGYNIQGKDAAPGGWSNGFQIHVLAVEDFALDRMMHAQRVGSQSMFPKVFDEQKKSVKQHARAFNGAVEAMLLCQRNKTTPTAACAATARIIYPDGLPDAFRAEKFQHGYANETLFIDSLFYRRPLVYYSQDARSAGYFLKNPKSVPDEVAVFQPWHMAFNFPENAGTEAGLLYDAGFAAAGQKPIDWDNKNLRLTLMSPSEITFAALCASSSLTVWYNSGSRVNGGIRTANPAKETPVGLAICAVGTRLEHPGCPDWSYIMVTQAQNTPDRYGPAAVNYKGLLVVARVLGLKASDFPTFEGAMARLMDTNGAVVLRHADDAYDAEHVQKLLDPKTEYIWFMDGNDFFNIKAYRARVRVMVDMCLKESKRAFEERNKFLGASGTSSQLDGYAVHFQGLGLGVWARDRASPDEQVFLFVDEVLKCVQRHNDPKLLAVRLAYMLFSSGEDRWPAFHAIPPKVGGTQILRVNQDTASPWPLAGKNVLPCAVFAGDSNSIAGNEYWTAAFDASMDPATAAASMVATVQNPFANPGMLAAPESRQVVSALEKLRYAKDREITEKDVALAVEPVRHDGVSAAATAATSPAPTRGVWYYNTAARPDSDIVLKAYEDVYVQELLEKSYLSVLKQISAAERTGTSPPFLKWEVNINEAFSVSLLETLVDGTWTLSARQYRKTDPSRRRLVVRLTPGETPEAVAQDLMRKKEAAAAAAAAPTDSSWVAAATEFAAKEGLALPAWVWLWNSASDPDRHMQWTPYDADVQLQLTKEFKHAKEAADERFKTTGKVPEDAMFMIVAGRFRVVVSYWSHEGRLVPRFRQERIGNSNAQRTVQRVRVEKTAGTAAAAATKNKAVLRAFAREVDDALSRPDAGAAHGFRVLATINTPDGSRLHALAAVKQKSSSPSEDQVVSLVCGEGGDAHGFKRVCGHTISLGRLETHIKRLQACAASEGCPKNREGYCPACWDGDDDDDEKDSGAA